MGNRPKVLLVLGAGPDQLPAYRQARRMGCAVVGTDQRSDAPGAVLADRFLPVSVRDPAGIVAALGGTRVDGVIAPAIDAAQPALQTLADHYDTPWRPSPRAVLASVDKGAFRQVLEGLPYPRVRFAQSASAAELLRAAKRLHYPLVAKPADASGSKGVQTVRSKAELPAAIERSQRFSYGGEVIVEELVEGRHLSAECFLRGGGVAFAAVSERRHTGPPHFLPTSYLLPARLDQATRTAVVRMLEGICRAVKLDAGPVAFDLVLGKREAYPIEMGARLGGNGIANLLHAAYGVNVVEAAIHLALGEPFALVPRWRRAAMLCVISSDRSGTLAAIHGREELLAAPTTEHLEVYPTVGSPVAAYTTASNKVAVLVLAGDTHDEVTAAEAAAARTLRFQVDEPAAGDPGPVRPRRPGAAIE